MEVCERRETDVLVVGCGMAGLAAAVRAGELGADVTILEKTTPEKKGGQTRYTESFRVASTECDLTEWGYQFDVPDYTPDDFYADINHQTSGKADPDLARRVVDCSGPTIEWLTTHGVEWEMDPPNVGYTAARTWMDGAEMVNTLVQTVTHQGGNVVYNATARELVETGDGQIRGVRASLPRGNVEFDARAVVLAAGGYESNPEKRTTYYGPGYGEMKVRGSPYNTGEAIDMALDVGARPVGQWSGAHMALIDAGSPDAEGGANRVDGYQYGVILNREGERFVDEGEDARAHTYAKFGRLIFEQPGHVGFIILDDRMNDHVWATGPSDPTKARRLEDLLEETEVERPSKAVRTVREYNAACAPSGPFEPDELDGNAATDIAPPKSNWAIPLETPPYYAYAVTGGITFTFGGVDQSPDAEVLDTTGHPIDGLYAAGNSTGGLFYDNYPGGTGLTNAAVFGRIAGERAALDAGVSTPATGLWVTSASGSNSSTT